MARKRPVWTKAMRRAAAERGRMGNREGKRRGGQLGGMLSWHTRTPEQQEEIRARLRAAGGQQKNTSPKARDAQRARGKAGMRNPTPLKVEFLAEAGMLKRVPVTTLGGVVVRKVPWPPARAEFPSHDAWLDGMQAWARENGYGKDGA